MKLKRRRLAISGNATKKRLESGQNSRSAYTGRTRVRPVTEGKELLRHEQARYSELVYRRDRGSEGAVPWRVAKDRVLIGEDMGMMV